MFNINRVIIVLLVLTFSITSFASSTITEEKYKQIEDNLLEGIKSENIGLQVSCAYFLGEMKSDRALIPLLQMLKSGESEEQRIIAALSLAKLNSVRGIFAVKQGIKFDDSERVQRLCKFFYNDYLMNQVEGDIIVEPFKVVDLNHEFNGMKLADFSSN